MDIAIHASWASVLQEEFTKPYWNELMNFVAIEYAQSSCFPEKKYIFHAFNLVSFDQVKVVILGQDPYHTPEAAMGLSFSVSNGGKSQPSLRNIFKELENDLQIQRTETDLTHWANQGVLLLNTVLTVQQGIPGSHQGKGWEQFTDAAITAISKKKKHVVFILWGNAAISKKKIIDETQHGIIASPHPSPFSAHRGFFGSSPFSRTNEYLGNHHISPIIWA